MAKHRVDHPLRIAEPVKHLGANERMLLQGRMPLEVEIAESGPVTILITDLLGHAVLTPL